MRGWAVVDLKPFKPGDKVIVNGWDGEIHTVLCNLHYRGLIGLEGLGEYVNANRCRHAYVEPEWPAHWGYDAEFWSDDSSPVQSKLIGYDPDANHPWVSSDKACWKFCRILPKETWVANGS